MSKYFVRLKEKKLEVELNGRKGKVEGKEFVYNLKKVNGNLYFFKFNNSVFEIPVVELSKNEFCISIEGLKYEAEARTELEEKSRILLSRSNVQTKGFQVKSPMPGLILKVNKKEGEKVNKGDSLLVLEAMKMENEIKAPTDGTITKVFVENGMKVEKSQPLVTIE